MFLLYKCIVSESRELKYPAESKDKVHITRFFEEFKHCCWPRHQLHLHLPTVYQLDYRQSGELETDCRPILTRQVKFNNFRTFTRTGRLSNTLAIIIFSPIGQFICVHCVHCIHDELVRTRMHFDQAGISKLHTYPRSCSPLKCTHSLLPLPSALSLRECAYNVRVKIHQVESKMKKKTLSRTTDSLCNIVCDWVLRL